MGRRRDGRLLTPGWGSTGRRVLLETLPLESIIIRNQFTAVLTRGGASALTNGEMMTLNANATECVTAVLATEETRTRPVLPVESPFAAHTRPSPNQIGIDGSQFSGTPLRCASALFILLIELAMDTTEAAHRGLHHALTIFQRIR